MNALITLVAVTGQQNTTPARIPIRPLAPEDLPGLASLHHDIYADAGAQQRGGGPGWIGVFRDGAATGQRKQHLS